MSENSLTTVASWLSSPLRAILTPWWERLVERKAESQAVKSKVVEAIIRFRVLDCQRKMHLDSNRAEGIARHVIDHFRPIARDSNTDYMSQRFIEDIECEIELHAVPLSTWVQLACLSFTRTFSPKQGIVLDFTDERGSRSHVSSMIVSLQKDLPFTPLLIMTGPNVAHLSPAAEVAIKAYCSRHTLPSATFELRQDIPIGFEEMQPSQSRQNLPQGWKPQ